MKSPTLEQTVAARNLLGDLTKLYPFAFCYPQRPLAIGTYAALRARLPDIDPKVLKVALRLWCSTTSYLQAVQHGRTRIDIYGSPAGDVSADDQAGVRRWLDARYGRQRRRPARHETP